MEEVAKAVGDIPSGLFVVAARDAKNGHIDGFLASWVQQVSFEPLLVTVALKPSRNVHELITGGEVFTINVVGDTNKGFMKHFWSGYDPNNNPFDQIKHTLSEEGGVLLDDAKSVMICRCKEVVHPGDHSLVIAEVIGSVTQDEESKSLVHLRKSGSSY